MTKLSDKDMLQKQPLLEPDSVEALATAKATTRLAKLLVRGKGTTYDPSIKIPKTSKQRLQAAAHDHALDINAFLHDHGPNTKLPSQTGTGADQHEETVLYLAYGSNMSIQSFRKSRGILPVSQLNAYVPGLSLTFDLPGFPYLEPCMAGTKFRDPNKTASSPEKQDPLLTSGQVWDKPLVGVVYEVTLSDYARIIATEGGGASYIDIVTDCFPFPESYQPDDPVPAHPPKDSQPFKAHTLLSPSSKDDLNKLSAKANGNANATTSLPSLPRNGPFSRTHPANDPPHPSQRYKNLLVSGAREQNLPSEYRAYLSSIHAYQITSTRQRIGRYVTIALWAPPVLFVVSLSSVFKDKHGRVPGWFAATQRTLVVLLWLWYDHFAKPVFGDGEKTEK
ncbi:hypothetical protein AJ78_03284 [Emergomyces pasteurianus Ep9510]|uniref:gamma-glutamylcyclotransferase n=1 Tax=Emergomyces pasteurianus Ep9510 TaxID=1447872 RepID=A0A1J9Q8J9_9EURO|nr:hypothetical protein AJ78_03284 [Emergomyces pasteurianus Ep9510]